MRQILVSAVLASLGAALPAQSYATAPKGHLTVSGNDYAYNYALAYFGSYYKSVRVQQTDPGFMAGKSVLSQMDYRTQNRVAYTELNGANISFSKVNLDMGHANSGSLFPLKPTFSANWNGTPTTVYSAKFSFPKNTSNLPQTWGNAGSFKFSTPFMYDSTKGDILQEWSHTGGIATNGNTLRGFHYLDGSSTSSGVFVDPSSSSPVGSRYLPRFPYGVTGACKDPRIRRLMPDTDSFARFGYWVYNATATVASWRNAYRIGVVTSSGTAPGGAMIGALTLGGSDAGIPLAGSCNKLHVNMSFPLVIMTKTAGTSTSNSITNWTSGFNTTATIPADPSYVGQVLYWQIGWNDSVKKNLRLTNASRIPLIAPPAILAAPPARYNYSFYSGTSTTPTRAQGQSTRFNPITRYARK